MSRGAVVAQESLVNGTRPPLVLALCTLMINVAVSASSSILIVHIVRAVRPRLQNLVLEVSTSTTTARPSLLICNLKVEYLW